MIDDMLLTSLLNLQEPLINILRNHQYAAYDLGGRKGTKRRKPIYSPDNTTHKGHIMC
jgi:hypothetical protein